MLRIEPQRSVNEHRARGAGRPAEGPRSLPSLRRRLHMNVSPGRLRVCGHRRSTRSTIVRAKASEGSIVLSSTAADSNGPARCRVLLATLLTFANREESRYRSPSKAHGPREENMLWGIDPLLTADLLYALRRMGHGDEIGDLRTSFAARHRRRRRCCARRSSRIDLFERLAINDDAVSARHRRRAGS